MARFSVGKRCSMTGPDNCMNLMTVAGNVVVLDGLLEPMPMTVHEIDFQIVVAAGVDFLQVQLEVPKFVLPQLRSQLRLLVAFQLHCSEKESKSVISTREFMWAIIFFILRLTHRILVCG